MKKMFALTTLVLLIASDSQVSAQEKESPYSPLLVIVIREDSLQKELKFSDEQTKKVMNVPTVAKEKIGKEKSDILASNWKRFNQSGSSLQSAQFSKVNNEYVRIAEKEYLTILTEAQLKRYKQIEIQHQGMDWFNSKEGIQQMKLNPEQAAKIRLLNFRLFTELGELRNYRPHYSELSEQEKNVLKKTIQSEYEAKIMDVLTASQKSAYKELIGLPFTITFTPREAKKTEQVN